MTVWSATSWSDDAATLGNTTFVLTCVVPLATLYVKVCDAAYSGMGSFGFGRVGRGHSVDGVPE